MSDAADPEECIHGLGPVSACVICNGRAAAEDKAGETLPIKIVTRYQGCCPTCDRVVYPGDLLAWFKDEPWRSVHADCYEGEYRT